MDLHPAFTIRPPKGWQPVDLAELWKYRELAWQLSLRDIRVRYKQTALGFAWVVIQPIFPMVAFTIFFGRLAGLEGRVPAGTPYSVFVLCGLIPWQLFATAINQSGSSVVNNRALITKIYFPRLIIPIVPILSGLADFTVGLTLLSVVMACFGVTPGTPVVFLPLFIVLALSAALAVGVWIAALNALYRDVQYTLALLTQIWLLVTPIAYPSSLVPERWRAIYSLNPMVGVVDGFRWSLLNGDPPRPLELAVSVVSVVITLIAGLYFFRRMEVTFADRV